MSVSKDLAVPFLIVFAVYNLSFSIYQLYLCFYRRHMVHGDGHDGSQLQDIERAVEMTPPLRRGQPLVVGPIASEEVEWSNSVVEVEDGRKEEKRGGEEEEKTTKYYCNKECAICLEGFRVGDECRVLTKCDHIYHKACIDPWFVQGYNFDCPICRHPVIISS